MKKQIKEPETGVWKRRGSTVYLLHEREYGTICNRFTIGVSADYGSGMGMEEDDAIASRIASDLNQESLKTIKSDINRLIEKGRNNPDISTGIGYHLGRLSAFLEVLEIIKEHILE